MVTACGSPLPKKRSGKPPPDTGGNVPDFTLTPPLQQLNFLWPRDDQPSTFPSYLLAVEKNLRRDIPTLDLFKFFSSFLI